MKNKIKFLVILTTLAFSSIITSAMQNSEQIKKPQENEFKNNVNTIKEEKYLGKKRFNQKEKIEEKNSKDLIEEKNLKNLYDKFFEEYNNFFPSKQLDDFKNKATEYIKDFQFLKKEDQIDEETVKKYVHNCYIVEPPIEKNPDAKNIYKKYIEKICPDNGKKFFEEKFNELINLDNGILESFKKIQKIYTEYMSFIKNLENKELFKKFNSNTNAVEKSFKKTEERMGYIQHLKKLISKTLSN